MKDNNEKNTAGKKPDKITAAQRHAEKVRKKNEKLVKKLRKNRWWLSFVMFILTTIFATVLLAIAALWMISYTVEDKIQNEYQNVQRMARIYDEKSEISDSDAYKALRYEERPFYVLDNNGQTKCSYGRNTSIESSGYFMVSTYEAGDRSVDEDSIDDELEEYDTEYDISIEDENIDFEDEDLEEYVDKNIKYQEKNVVVYLDLESEYLQQNDDGEFYVDIMKLFGIDFSLKEGLNIDFTTKDARVVPFWIEIPVKEGKLVAKSSVVVEAKDTAFVVIAVLAYVFIILVGFIIAVVNFVNNLKNHRRVNKLLFTDMATNSHNWTWFLYQGSNLMRRWRNADKNYAVMDFDFVKFRNFCMAHSVQEGERVLCTVDDVICSHLDKKELCSHNSSAHFAVLMKYDTDENLNDRINGILRELEHIDDTHVFSYHVGVDKLNAMYDENGKLIKRKDIDIEKAYNNACAASATLADNDDTGIAFFDEKLLEEQRWLDIVQENQQKALDNEEFVVYYQPKYDPRTNELRGAEALIRWQSPEYGFVSPGRIIPIFEKNGFITEIDHYMITHVARDQKTWLDKGLKCVPVSVNVSRAHFIESDLAEQIRDMIDNEGAPRNLVEIELTESAFFDDKKALINIIKKLKGYGFSVSMDDFGAGYSSLNSLKDMPLDVLKLDADFFRGETDGDRGEIVVSEAIKLAQKLNMHTVAEGVEAREQVDFLAEQGCDMIQGYYYAKPMPKEEYEGRMASPVAEVEEQPAAEAAKGQPAVAVSAE